MKNRSIFFMFVLFSCLYTQQNLAQTNIQLTNTTSFNRSNEIVEVPLSSEIYESLSSLVLFDNFDLPVPYQIIPYEKKIIFPADVNKNRTKTYTLKEGTPQTGETKTYAAIMKPGSRADIAWENDRAAYRMYAKKLLSSEPNTSNGVDLWAKKMSEPIIEKMYTYANYHNEQTEGVDAYSVGGKTLGAGGIVAYVNNKLWLHNPYDECEIIMNGPLRSEFVLTYKKVEIDGDYYTKTLRVTTNANGLLNKAVVKFEGTEKPMKIAAGIFLHTGTNGSQFTETKNILGYAENKSEGTVTSPNARFYTGIYMPGETSLTTISNQRIIYCDYTVGTEFTYYFGGGWNIFPVGEYEKDQDWFNALSNFKECINNPLYTKNTPSSMEKIDVSGKISIYPNPVTGQRFSINFSKEISEEITLSIYNLSGNKLYDRKVFFSGQNLEVDDMTLDSGFYILKVETGTERINQTFIKNQ